MTKVWLAYLGGRLAAHIYLTKRDRRHFARGYARALRDQHALSEFIAGYDRWVPKP